MSPTLSTQLKELRNKAGLTLQQVATLAGTSVAAMHRYENGWERFDVRTLGKIAQALGVEMVITFRLKTKKRMNPNVYQIFKPLFWDVRIAKNKLTKHRDWLVQRVLELGNLEQVRALFSLFEFTAIRDSFAHQQHKFSRKTQIAWSSYFNLKDPKCILKSFQKEPTRFMHV